MEPLTYKSPVPDNREGMSGVHELDGEQGGEVVALPEFDELVGGYS